MTPAGAALLALRLRDIAAEAVDLERTLTFKRAMERIAPSPLASSENVVRLGSVR